MSKPPHAETILIEGEDAVAFAHAQFSSDVLALANDAWQFSAWLDPQGRVRYFFHLARIADNRLLLLLRGGTAVDMVAALQRFVFRSKVTLLAYAPRALFTGPALPMQTMGPFDARASFGCGTHSLQINDGNPDASDDAWRLVQLRMGWPWIPEALLNTLLSSSLSLQRLQGVTVDKGCYPGQEIVARMHFRSGYKKHLYHLNLSLAEISGELLRANTEEKGRLLQVISSEHGIEALAVLNDDFVAQAINQILPPTDHGLIMRVLETWPA